MNIYSRAEPGLLLHVVHRRTDFRGGRRVDVAAPEESLQLAALDAPGGTLYKSHRHLVATRPDAITQEAWVVIEGRVEVSYYDVDGTPLEVVMLDQGDCSITFRGGHGYRMLGARTRVYEFKTGPYRGQAADKVFIGADA